MAKRRTPTTRIDPTRTTMLVRRMVGVLSRRYNKLLRDIVELVEKEDAFGLKNPRIVTNTRWAFRTESEQVEAFVDWLQSRIDSEVLSRSTRDEILLQYIQEGYRKGTGRAFEQTRPDTSLDFYRGTKQQFLSDSFNHPIGIERVRQLAGRVFTDLRGVNADMAVRMSRTLLEGLTQGKSPRDIARDLAKEVGVGRTRARRIARTEIIRAHSEGQLDGFEKLGVAQIGVMAEWSTAGDNRVCDLCGPLNNIVLKVSEARGMIPRHPNCRCAWIPANVAEPEKGQKRSKRAIDKSVRKSLGAEIGDKDTKTTIKDQREKTNWPGGKRDIDKVRPTPTVREEALRRSWRAGKKVANPIIQIGNAGPLIASELVKEAGLSPSVAKVAMVAATIIDFAVPGIPAGSIAVSVLAHFKSPFTSWRAGKKLVQYLWKVGKKKIRDIRRGV